MELCNFDYLKSISPGNTAFVTQMIQLFIKNVPLAYEAMNSSLKTSDWLVMQHHAHKLKSHFDCIGLPEGFREKARLIEEYAQNQEHLDLIPDLLKKLENESLVVFKELEIELNNDKR